jgi:hypothetical protein
MLNPVTSNHLYLFLYNFFLRKKRTFDAFRVSAVRFINYYYYYTNILRAIVQDLDILDIFSPRVAY